MKGGPELHLCPGGREMKTISQRPRVYLSTANIEDDG